MKRLFRLVLASLLVISFNGHSQEREHGVHIGFFYPLSTHGTQAGTYSNYFSLHAIAGVSREEKGFSVAGISNIIHEDARGFQAAGFSNHIGGFSEGFKAAGFMNIYHSAKGFQAAGFTNLSSGSITGMQAAGFMNKADNFHGFQAAGFLNMSQNIRGTQAAGFMNLAEDVQGSQLAAFLNIARKVKGAQVSGFINIADSCEYPVGLINIIGNGEKWLGITTDDNLTTLVTFRSGSKKLYGIIGLGYNFENRKQVFARQYGLGAHFFTTNNFRLKTEATALSLESFRRGSFDKFSLTAMPSLRIGAMMEVFAGPSLNFVNTNTAEGRNLIGHYIWTDTNHDDLNGLYIGYTAGLHLRL